VGKPTHFISHRWQAEFAATVAAVAGYFGHNESSAWDGIFVWIDILVSFACMMLLCHLA
jgi:hypothetical protein